jgi:hypothetical protein
MIVTEQNLIDEFDKRDIPVNKRVLTDWRAKSYLPPLRVKGLGRGMGTTYFWSDAKVIERALLVDEALNSRYRGPKVLMILWLFGYDISLTSIRDHLLTGLSKVARLTRGTSEDREAIEEHIYDLTEKYYQLASKYPQLELPQDKPATVMEMILNIFANPAYDLSDTPFQEGITDSIQSERDGRSVPTSTSILPEAERIRNVALKWRFVHEHFSLSHMQDALAKATDEKLRQVQKDVTTLFEFLGQQFAGKLELEELRDWRVQAAYSVGMLLTVIDLTLRHQGFGHFIDSGLSRLMTQENQFG